MNLVKAMATVGGLTALSRLAGFARDVLTAAILGAGPIADAFFVALKLPNFFRRVTAEGAFSVSFVPLYTEALEKEGREQADDFAGNAMVIMFWILLAFTIVVMIFMPAVILLIAPGFSDDPERFNLAVTLSRITFPYLLMMSVSSLLGGVLNAHGRFAPFAAAPIFFNLALIGALVLAWKFQSAAHALAMGVLVAGVLQFFLLYIFIRRENIKLRIGRPHFDARIKKLFRLMGPGVIGAGIMQINLFADMIIGSFLPVGSIAYLYYADRLNQLPLGIVGIAVGTALLPMLSRAMAKVEKEGQDDGSAQDLFNRALEYCLLLALPASAALAVIPLTLITVLFERGAFTAADSAVTAQILACYSIGLPAYIATKVFSTAHWARHDTKTPVRISISGVILNIILALAMVGSMGVVGIALATGLTGWVQYVLHVRALKNHPQAQLDDRFRRTAPKIIASTCIMSAALYILALLMEDWVFGATAFYKFSAIAILTGTGALIYGISIVVTGALTLKDLKDQLQK